MTIVALGNALLGGTDAAPFPSRAAGARRRAAAAGASATRRPWSRHARSSDQPHGARRRGRRAVPRLYDAARCRRRATQLLSNGRYSVMVTRRAAATAGCDDLGGQALARGPDAGRLRQLRLPARPDRGRRWSAGVPADRARARRLRGDPRRTGYASRARIDGIATAARDHGLARGRCGGAAAHAHEPGRATRADRGDQLRAKWCWRRRRPTSRTRRSRTCSSRPRRCPSRRAARFAPAARRRRAASLRRACASAPAPPASRMSTTRPTARVSSAAAARRAGRSRSSAVASSRRTTGPVLDPIFSLRTRVVLPPGGEPRLLLTTLVADSREQALELAEKYRDLDALPARLDARVDARAGRAQLSRDRDRRGARLPGARGPGCCSAIAALRPRRTC